MLGTNSVGVNQYFPSPLRLSWANCYKQKVLCKCSEGVREKKKIWGIQARMLGLAPAVPSAPCVSQADHLPQPQFPHPLEILGIKGCWLSAQTGSTKVTVVVPPASSFPRETAWSLGLGINTFPCHCYYLNNPPTGTWNANAYIDKMIQRAKPAWKWMRVLSVLWGRASRFWLEGFSERGHSRMEGWVMRGNQPSQDVGETVSKQRLRGQPAHCNLEP